MVSISSILTTGLSTPMVTHVVLVSIRNGPVRTAGVVSHSARSFVPCCGVRSWVILIRTEVGGILSMDLLS